MKIAIPAEGPDFNARVGDRLGLSPYLFIVDTESGAFNAIRNPGDSTSGGGMQIIALIIAGLNMASADGGRHEKAKRQLIGIAIAAIAIFGSKVIVQALVSFVPGANSSF